MNNSEKQLLHLVLCALHDKIPDTKLISSLNYEDLLKISKFHSLTVMTAYALESAGIKNKEINEEKNLVLRNILLLDNERRKICNFFDENHIWYMPLKGVYLKEYYPRTGMRQMCDNDILIDPDGISSTDKWMLERGYSKHEESSHDISYLKPPCYNYEIHYALVADYHGHSWAEYYSSVKEKLIQKSENSFEYCFTNEDFYIFMCLHEYKHYSSGGTGLRSLIDVYVFLDKFSEKLDWEYIREECKKLEIADFEEKSRLLALKLLSSDEIPELNDDEAEMLGFYFNSGVYGTISNKAEQRMNSFNSDSKFVYFFRRIFPPLDVYKRRFPFFYKHRILLPIGWGYRLLRGIFCKKSSIKAEIKAVDNIKRTHN